MEIAAQQPFSAAASSASSISQDDLLKVLLTQLRFQDPLNPTDNSEFIAQLAQFTSLDQSRQTNDGIQALLQVSSANQSLALLGRTVEIGISSGSEVGEITTVSFNDGVPFLTMKTALGTVIDGINISQVELVR